MSLFQARDEQLLHTRDWSDDNRRSFLQNLDLADVEVSDWEAQFIGRNLHEGVENPTYSPKQRLCIEQLYTKYNSVV